MPRFSDKNGSYLDLRIRIVHGLFYIGPYRMVI